MAGIMIASKTEHNTTMLRLLHEGKIIDRMEVDSLIFLPEEKIAGMDGAELYQEITDALTPFYAKGMSFKSVVYDDLEVNMPGPVFYTPKP